MSQAHAGETRPRKLPGFGKLSIEEEGVGDKGKVAGITCIAGSKNLSKGFQKLNSTIGLSNYSDLRLFTGLAMAALIV